jgi:hypothetical protein
MAAPLGNQNGAKGKQWSAAIERAIERMGDPTIDPDVPIARTPKAKGLDMLAERFLKEVESGMVGFKELGDRLDGKPAQTIVGEDDRPLRVVQRIERVIIDNAKD